ncbi:hypothetical protein [Bradyrhizobium sp. sGM-13]|uniref:hypothetical protein n=1 Tax=Bradyrhizobium sp. sGM-13 TaxID=2831781 RepID=UPI001BCAC945|nr:hypothetical protein [Bradyrhizobium sp. sGM-13]
MHGSSEGVGLENGEDPSLNGNALVLYADASLLLKTTKMCDIIAPKQSVSFSISDTAMTVRAGKSLMIEATIPVRLENSSDHLPLTFEASTRFTAVIPEDGTRCEFRFCFVRAESAPSSAQTFIGTVADLKIRWPYKTTNAPPVSCDELRDAKPVAPSEIAKAVMMARPFATDKDTTAPTSSIGILGAIAKASTSIGRRSVTSDKLSGLEMTITRPDSKAIAEALRQFDPLSTQFCKMGQTQIFFDDAFRLRIPRADKDVPWLEEPFEAYQEFQFDDQALSESLSWILSQKPKHHGMGGPIDIRSDDTAQNLIFSYALDNGRAVVECPCTSKHVVDGIHLLVGYSNLSKLSGFAGSSTSLEICPSSIRFNETANDFSVCTEIAAARSAS